MREFFVKKDSTHNIGSPFLEEVPTVDEAQIVSIVKLFSMSASTHISPNPVFDSRCRIFEALKLWWCVDVIIVDFDVGKREDSI